MWGKPPSYVADACERVRDHALALESNWFTTISTMPLQVVYVFIVVIFSLAVWESVWPHVLSDMPGTSAGGVSSLLSVSQRVGAWS